jgi:cholesterol transport system auxiliary component
MIKRWIILKRLMFVLSLSLLLACSPPQPLQTRVYVLQAELEPTQATVRSDAVLLVAQVRAEAGFDTRQIAYIEAPSTLSYFSQSEWADEPAKLLTPLMAEAIAKTGAYRAVLTQPTPVLAEQRLDIEILRLQQDFLSQPSQLRFSLRASLSAAASNSLIASRIFEAREAATSEDAYGGVQAANRALSTLLTELIDWLLAQQTT